MDGARWVRQEILDRHPAADLAVIAVWFPNVEGDVRESWPRRLLDDPRVVHLWEEGQGIGRWYGARTRPGQDWTEWDAFFVYAPDARWAEGPPPALAWGRTILRERERLRGAVAPYVEPAPPSGAAGRKSAPVAVQQTAAGRSGRAMSARDHPPPRNGAAMASLILVDFRLFPDNHALPAQFALGGLDFAAIDPSTPPFVNETANDRGLQFKRTGLRISLPGMLDSVLMTAGGFAGPITVRALDAAGKVIKSQQLQPPNKYIRYMLNAPGMSTIELVDGGHEGILVEIVAPC